MQQGVVDARDLDADPGRLSQRHDDLVAELEAMTRLHEFGARLHLTHELGGALDEALVAIMSSQGADFGCIHVNDAEQGGLVVVAQRNFQPALPARMTPGSSDDCASSRAVSMKTRVVIEDVENETAPVEDRRIAATLGFRAMQATPLIGHSGELLGVLSTHFRTPHRLSSSALRMTDFYCHYVTQTIERRRSQEERSKLASIVENSADFVGIASLAGHPLFLNAAGRRMVGLDESEPLIGDVHAYLAEEDRERLDSEIMPAVERAGFWDGETSLRHIRTGAAIPVLQHIFFIREPQTGQRFALATVCRDITARRRAEHAASDARRELARAGRLLSLGELSTSIAHEINQPLGAIVANGAACLRWIDREVPNIAEARASVQRIVRDAKRASDVILRIRAFSTKATLSRALVNVNDVIREVLALLHNEIHRESVVLRTQLAEDLPTVTADRVELQQVVLNLVINGIEAMRTVVERPRNLSISSTHRGAAAVEVHVSDSGGGIAPQQAGRLFDAFFTTKGQGMGLGLSISRRIIEGYGGQLLAIPNPDHGLTLCFSLPASGTHLQN